MVYIALKAGRSDLVGETPKEKATVLQLFGVISDINKKLYSAVFSPNFKHEMDLVQKNYKFTEPIKLLSKFLGDEEFFLGRVTIVDFYASVVMTWLGIFLESTGFKNHFT